MMVKQAAVGLKIMQNAKLMMSERKQELIDNYNKNHKPQQSYRNLVVVNQFLLSHHVFQFPDRIVSDTCFFLPFFLSFFSVLSSLNLSFFVYSTTLFF